MGSKATIEVSKELKTYSKKIIDQQTENKFDLSNLMKDITEGVKGIEKANKKNTIQITNIEESFKELNIQLSLKQEEIASLKRDKNMMIGNIIKILDELYYMYRALKETGNKTWLESMDLMFKVIDKNIQEIGIVEIPSMNEIFDENSHEFSDCISDPTQKQYLIVDVVRKGYRFNGKMRRALVIINKFE